MACSSQQSDASGEAGLAHTSVSVQAPAVVDAVLAAMDCAAHVVQQHGGCLLLLCLRFVYSLQMLSG